MTRVKSTRVLAKNTKNTDMKETSTTLITGGAGFIGSHLVDKFLTEEYRVVVLDNLQTGNLKNISHHLRRDGFKYVVGDVREFGLVAKLVSRVDVAIHCAAQTSVDKSVEDPLFDAQNNVVGTLILLDAARRSKRLERFVYISSGAVYGFPRYVPIDENHPREPVSPYGASKLAGELYVNVFNKLYGLPTICIRPFNVYGKRQDLNSSYSGVISKFLERIEKGLPPLIHGDGSQTRDFIHVQDVIDMVVLAIGRDEAVGGTFNCGTGREISINDLARLMISISGLNLNPEYSASRPGDIKRNCADMARAEKTLGFKPKISIEQGLMELFSYSHKA